MKRTRCEDRSKEQSRAGQNKKANNLNQMNVTSYCTNKTEMKVKMKKAIARMKIIFWGKNRTNTNKMIKIFDSLYQFGFGLAKHCF